MKKLVAAATVIVGLFVQALPVLSHATSLHPDTFKTRYELKNFSVNPETVLLESIVSLPEGKEASGHVVLDKAANKITVTIQRPFHCPRGRVCAMVMPRPLYLEFALTQTIVPFCGGTIYLGQLVSEENLKAQISVYDDRGNVCERGERGRPNLYNVTVELSEVLVDGNQEPLVINSTLKGYAQETDQE